MSPSSEPPVPVRLPALARGGIDRAADERADPELLDRVRRDPSARVVAIHGDRAPLDECGALRTVRVDEIRPGVAWAFLGRGADRSPVLVAAAAHEEDSPLVGVGVDGDADHAVRWASLRAVGGELSAVEAGLFVEALALGRWLVDAPFCSHCGARTEERAAGWARHCPVCGREHFPRTDPAVIVAVISADGSALLLGKNALWGDRNLYSTFAGFVEAGESLESAIVREVQEEAGVVVDALQYRGSQSWPYPRSLMLGFHAIATDAAAARPDGEEIVDVRWFDRAEIRAALRGEGEVLLPGTASIAHRLIADWADVPA